MVSDEKAARALAADLRAFEERVTDLAIGVERMLASIAQVLETGNGGPARWVMEVEEEMQEAQRSFLAQGLALQARYAPVGGALARLIELQQALIEFGHITEHCQRAARHALTLAGTGLLADLSHAGDPRAIAHIPSATQSLLHALRHQLRGAIVTLVDHDPRKKQQLIADAQMVANYCAAAVVQLQECIAAQPAAALSLTRLLFVVYELRCIHERLIAVGYGPHYPASVPVSVAI